MWKCWFFLLFGCQNFSEIIYDMYGISNIICFFKYCFPLFFLKFLCDGERYDPFSMISECCSLVLMWMVRGKLDCCISTCSFPVDTYVHVVIICM